MEAIKRVSKKTGQTFYIVGIESEESMFSVMDGQGMCRRCGEFTDGVEPDARQYTCHACGQQAVYGIEELVMLGQFVTLEEGGNE